MRRRSLTAGCTSPAAFGERSSSRGHLLTTMVSRPLSPWTPRLIWATLLAVATAGAAAAAPPEAFPELAVVPAAPEAAPPAPAPADAAEAGLPEGLETTGATGPMLELT